MASRSERTRAFASSKGSKTAAQWFAYVGGLVLIAAGLIGFAYDGSFETGQGIDGDEVFGILEVNGIHNIVHIASGLLLLLVARRAGRRAQALRPTCRSGNGELRVGF